MTATSIEIEAHVIEILDSDGIDSESAIMAFRTAPICYKRVARQLASDSSLSSDESHQYRCVQIGANKYVVEAVLTKEGDAKKLTRAWKTRRYHWWRHWLSWLKSQDEFYQEPELIDAQTLNHGWSPILGIVGLMLFIMRRLSIYELSKHLIPHISGENRTHARYLDFYLLAKWSALVLAIGFADHLRPRPLWGFLFFASILQVIQTSFYHEFWRTLRQSATRTEGFVYNRLRNLLISFGNIIYVTACYGLVYFFSGGLLVENHPASISTSMYFSFTVAWSVGPVGTEVAVKNFVPLLSCLQIVTTLFLFSVLLGIVVSGIKPLKEAKP